MHDEFAPDEFMLDEEVEEEVEGLADEEEGEDDPLADDEDEEEL